MTHKKLVLELGERAYDIHIGSGLIEKAADYIPLDLKERSVFILTDENVLMPHAQKLQAALTPHAATVHVKAVPPGERSKDFETLQSVLHWMLDHKVERSSLLIAIGGGVVGDLGGFAASVILRGIPFVQVPTTLLSMVDSSVGGKTGINTVHGKNLVGSFYQPLGVIADIDTLQTLPQRQLLAGYAECVKHACIFDEALFKWFEDNHENLLTLDTDLMTENIYRNCSIKAKVVEADEKESGMRALLNLGHTFGHALEAAAGYDGTLLHGEGVALGMLMAYSLSVKMQLCDKKDLQRLRTHLEAVELSVTVPFTTQADILFEAMQRDKKSSKGTITFILAEKIGKAVLSRDVNMDDVKTVLQEALA